MSPGTRTVPARLPPPARVRLSEAAQSVAKGKGAGLGGSYGRASAVVGTDRHEAREERVTHRNGPGPAPSTLRWGISSCGSRSAALGRVYEKPSQAQCLILFLPAHQCQKSSDVMGQSGQSLGDRPEAVDPHAGALAVAMGVFPELGVSEPVPGVSINQRSRRCCSSAWAAVCE